MEQFASQNINQLRVVGIGTQDSLSFAENFHELMRPQAVTLLWDETRNSWRNLGVFSQPSWMLLNAEGEPIIPLRLGGINEGLALNAINQG